MMLPEERIGWRHAGNNGMRNNDAALALANRAFLPAAPAASEPP